MSSIMPSTSATPGNITELLFEKKSHSVSETKKTKDEEIFWIIKDGRLQKDVAPPPMTKQPVFQTEQPTAVKPVNNRSYLHGPPIHSMVFSTLPQLLEKRSEDTPDQEAHVFWSVQQQNRLQRESISFSVLSERSAILAGNFLEMGLKPEDKIAIIGDNCPDWVYVEYAALRVKICLVRLHSSLVTAESVRRVVFQQQCRAMIVSPGTDDVILKKVIQVIPGMKSVSDLMAKLPNMRLMLMGESHPQIPVRTIQELVVSTKHMEEVILTQDAIDPHDIAIAYSTSGTSSFPKFVAMTHYSYINNVLATSNKQFQSADTRFFNDRPFTWIGSGLHSAVCLGVTIVHMDTSVTHVAGNTSMVLSIMEEEKITVSMSLSTIMNEVRESKNGRYEFPSSVKYIITGGERLSNELMEFCREQFEATMVLYASSESFVASKGVISKYTSKKSSFYKLEPLPHVEVKVTDQDEKTVPVGTPGSLWVRSPYLFESYLNYSTYDVDKSKTMFHKTGGHGQGLWFNTEDLAIIDEDGTVEVIGRHSDIITRDDVMIYPFTYESAIRKFPKVNEVYVTGVSNRKMGQEIVVCVSFQKGYWVGEEGIVGYLQREGVKPMPKHFMVLDQFPHIANGKMDRKELNLKVQEKFSDRK